MTAHQPMPPERRSVTQRFQVGELKGYVTADFRPDNTIGEVFLRCNKQGSLERGLLHTVALLISTLLQHGIPLERVAEKLRGVEFDPQGPTRDPRIPRARSIVDYLARWLEATQARYQPPQSTFLPSGGPQDAPLGGGKAQGSTLGPEAL